MLVSKGNTLPFVKHWFQSQGNHETRRKQRCFEGQGGKLQIDAKIMINVQRLVAGIEALSGE